MRLAQQLLRLVFVAIRVVTSMRIFVGVSNNIRRAYWSARLGSLGQHSSLFKQVVIHAPECVRIGSNCTIAEFVHMWGSGGIDIGDRVLIASGAAITTVTHSTEAEQFALSSIRKAVVIEDDVWIGTGAVILPGVCLGSGCIVGAGAVVTRSVPKRAIAAGVPARVVRYRADAPAAATVNH